MIQMVWLYTERNVKDYRSCILGRDYYVFVDNAQELRKGGYVNACAMIKNARVCLAFSCVNLEGGGITHIKSPVRSLCGLLLIWGTLK